MSSIEERLTAVEAEVRIAREEAAAARALAAGADRDVAEYRAEMRGHTRLLNALRESQVEQGSELVSLREDLTALRTEMVGRFDQVAGGLEHIARLVEGIDGTAAGNAS